MNKAKDQQGLLNYLTNIILRPHRQIYNIDKLGPSKIVVKSNEKSISLLQSMSKNEKHLPKQLQQSYCELIEVNRKEVTIKSGGKNVQMSIYQPQLTITQKNIDNSLKNRNEVQKNSKDFFPYQHIKKHNKSYQNCVVFLHANSGSRLEGLQYAKYILQYRTLCVSFDYSGSGISQGDYTTMGVNQSLDLSSVMNYLREKYNIKRFSLWGRSMGAVTGLYYLLTKYKFDYSKIKIASCILDSPFSNLQEVILELASKKSNLPQFVFKPVLQIIQQDIIKRLKVNIFTQLNLKQKIKNLNEQEMRLINSINFLGLTSKQDKMIGSEHCQALCQLLLSSDARNSDLVDQKRLIIQNNSDKHLAMLIQFKKEINMKGDLIYIQGDHNKPRSNQVKQKVSFFIQDSFYSYKDNLFNAKQNQKKSEKQIQNRMSFSKGGLNLKTKLSFAKAVTSLKSRKESAVIVDQKQQRKQITANVSTQNQEQNYNIINLKNIKAKQEGKKSLSKQKGSSIRNSLSKNFLLKQRKQTFQNNQISNIKGLNIISKNMQTQKSSSKITKQEQNHLKFNNRAYQTLQNSKHQQLINKTQKNNDSPHINLANFLNKVKLIQNTPKYKDEKEKVQNNINDQKYMSNGSINNSVNNSINNSVNKSSNNESNNKKSFQNQISPLNLSQNEQNLNAQQSLTQRFTGRNTNFQSLPSDRYNRNLQSQQYVYINQFQHSPGINTSPFNISIDSKNNQSFDVHNSFQEESFRKKQISQVLDATDISIKNSPPKTPNVKFSISQLRNKQDEDKKFSNNYKLSVKENKLQQNNVTKWNSNKTQQVVNSNMSLRSQNSFIKQSPNSLHFKRKQPAQTNSISNSDISYDKPQEFIHKNQQNTPFLHHRQRVFTGQTPNPNTNYQSNNIFKQNVSNSFSENSQFSIKQMMINNGHKGLTQSSTFNNYYIPVENKGFQQNFQSINTNNSTQLGSNNTQKPLSSNCYSNSLQTTSFGSISKSMKTSQQPCLDLDHNQTIRKEIQNGGGNIFLQNYPPQYHQNINLTNNNFIYTQSPINQHYLNNSNGTQHFPSNQSFFKNNNLNYTIGYQNMNQNLEPKESIQYKKKITKLLD